MWHNYYVKDCAQWRAIKRCKCFHRSTGWQTTIGRFAWPRHTHTCEATKIKRCQCFFPRWVKAMRLLQQDRRASANNQLPRNWTAFVAKCHAGQAKRASMSPSGTSAMRNEGGCHQVPRLPRKVPRCHRRPAPPKRPTRASPVCATPATQRECRCHQVPHWMSPRATPATQRECRCHQVPHLPRETKVNVTKCHACHAKCRGVTGDQQRPSAPPEPAQCHKCHACRPATQRECRCHQVPHLPRKTKVDVAKCHACHAKCRGVTGLKSKRNVKQIVQWQQICEQNAK